MVSYGNRPDGGTDDKTNLVRCGSRRKSPCVWSSATSIGFGCILVRGTAAAWACRPNLRTLDLARSCCLSHTWLRHYQIDWDGDTLAVPLIQLEAPEADAETQQAIADWHYWVNQGYEFG